MRHARNARTLKEVVAVRDVQRQAAELTLTRAHEALRVARDDATSCAERLEDDQLQWREILDQPALSLTLAAGWAGEVRRSETTLDAATDAVRHTENSRAKAARGWQTALSQADMALELSRRADRRLDRLREEVATDALADRAAQNWRRS